jgi:hypothetical protein
MSRISLIVLHLHISQNCTKKSVFLLRPAEENATPEESFLRQAKNQKIVMFAA